MRSLEPATLLRDRVLDARLAALLWLLVDGGVPVVVAGDVPVLVRAELAGAILATDPARRWIVIDADDEDVSPDRLAAFLRGGIGLGITVAATDLESVLERLTAHELAEDAVRRLGVVVIATETELGLRCSVVHYLRPTERDAQGHIQRRPPAVLAAWDERADAYEDYAWGITPELADRVDRSQADLEERQHERTRFLAGVGDAAEPYAQVVADYLAAEPPRVPAPRHAPASPSPFHGGLTDRH